jgi:Tol biopolymer transport system component
MTGTSAIHIRRLRVPVVAAAMLALVSVPAAHATFEGEPGPIAFQRFPDPNDSDRSHIFRVEAPGGAARRLTHLPNISSFPDYSPNGRRIAFTHPFEGRDALFTMKADGSDRVRLTAECTGECLGDSASAWAPNGRRIVFERAYGPIVDDNASALELVVARADGRRERVVRSFPLVGGGWEPHGAQWSPNGRRLAVMLLNVSKPETPSAIYVLKPDGTNLHQITPIRLNAGNPDWSPNGKRIVFNSHYEGQSLAQIYTVRPDGTRLRRVRRQPEGQNAFEPVFSPDGKRIAFVDTRQSGLPHLSTMRRNGTRLEKVTHGRVVDVQPEWGARPR